MFVIMMLVMMISVRLFLKSGVSGCIWCYLLFVSVVDGFMVDVCGFGVRGGCGLFIGWFDVFW